MNLNEKTAMVLELLDASDQDLDGKISTYLTIAKREILSWRYSYAPDSMPDDVPPEYEMTQIQAVVMGYTHAGAEGEYLHNENGINRHFTYADMLEYIRKNVIPLAKVVIG